MSEKLDEKALDTILTIFENEIRDDAETADGDRILLEAARQELTALIPPAPSGAKAVAVGYARSVDVDPAERPFEGRNSFWVSENKNAYYSIPIYSSALAHPQPAEVGRVLEWRTMDSAPKDASEIIYTNKFGEIGFCYWSEAGSPFDQSMWWDELADDECCPVGWLPRTCLPAARDLLSKTGRTGE